MNEKVSGYIKLYTFLESFAHNCYRRWWSRCYSLGQLKEAKRVYSPWKPLTKGQKKEIAAFWGLRHPVRTDFITHEIMLNVKGEFDVRYVPEKIFRLYLDPAMGDRKLLWAWDDKNYFDVHQPSLPFPQTYVRNVNGFFLDSKYQPITLEEAKLLATNHLPFIIKPSLISGEGKNVRLISDEKQVREVFSTYDKDYLIQEVVNQCDELKQMSPRSVNTMRLVTAIMDGHPQLLTSQLLCNTTDSVAVNANSAPGVGVVIINIEKEGKLAQTGYYENAKKLQKMPSGVVFGGVKVPAYDEAVRFALEAHKRVPMLGFIGWDVAIDSNNKPVFIEWNLRGIEIFHSQLTNGPLFGKYTDYFAAKAKELINRK